MAVYENLKLKLAVSFTPNGAAQIEDAWGAKVTLTRLNNEACHSTIENKFSFWDIILVIPRKTQIMKIMVACD